LHSNLHTKEMARISKATKIDLYQSLVLPRLIEEKMLILLRQGKISKWFSGIGQEAISVGCTNALEEQDTIFTMHRNLGVFTSRGIPLTRLFSQWEGKANGFTKGRDRSFHFGAPEYNIVGMISHLGPQLSLAAGVSLGAMLAQKNKIALAFTGEGGTSQGEFHEALNTAAVWKIPVIFVIENNGYGLSTPTNEQYACKDLADRAKGYGMQSSIIDGNNVLEVYDTIKSIRKKILKNPQPWLVECKTFRMRGHEEASGTKYVPQELFDKWQKYDPILKLEKELVDKGIITDVEIEALKKATKAKINQDLEKAYEEESISSSELIELTDVYHQKNTPVVSPQGTKRQMRLIDAISDGLRQSMQKHNNLILMGQDIAEYGGVFKITEGFLEEFGKDRVRNTPLCESAIVGIALGLAMENYKVMMEMQFSDFVTCGFNQIINNLAKVHYRWGQNADVVIRMPTGGSVGAGPFHSQNTEAWFTHTPGLKVIYPSNPIDAKGLLIAAIEDPNPVMFFEHKALYRQLSDDVHESYYTTEIGKANIIRKGSDLTIITYGLGVLWAKEVAEEYDNKIEILDLVTLSPLDYITILSSVKKTNKVLVLHEDSLFGGLGGEISAYISEHCFESLDAPVRRVGGLDTPIPFSKELEKIHLANSRLSETVKELLEY
jgi:2-oxoisovalerate dehydrogenase E1 component